MNRDILDDGPDIADHLFGTERVSLTRPAGILSEHFGNDCFYCNARLRTGRHVDHVLPWSRVPIDGLANLVLACQPCNTSKSDVLPAPTYVSRALDRGQDVIDALADEIRWPSQYSRVKSASRGLYSTQPDTTPIWLGARHIQPLKRVDFGRWDVEL